MTKTDAITCPPLVEPSWLAERLHDPSVRVLDCTTHMYPQPVGPSRIESGLADFQQRHIPGASHVCMVEDLSDKEGAYPYTAIDNKRFALLMQRLGIDRADHVVLYGHSGISSITRAWFIFHLNGFEQVSILNGGLGAWLAQALPVTNHSTTASRLASPQSYQQRSCLATQQDVMEALISGDYQLINALSSEQFTGTGGAHYGRPGRIPDSLNLPAREMVDAQTGRFLDALALEGSVKRAGINVSAPSIHYCGGGIAATTSAFVLHTLGAKDWRVYDNSLLEWCQLAQCPMQCDPA